ncbi:MAG: cell wall hydrolase [Christensenellaceae bacterium]|nr:cell wall hydrolase [Christensenellaceae bacterium]
MANVIYNRLLSPKFPGTVVEVLYQKSQFSTTNLKTPSSAAVAAVQQIFINGDLILPANVMYFHAASRGVTRDGYAYYGTFGGNIFFSKA